MWDSNQLRYAVYEWLLRLNRAYYKRLNTRSYNPDGIDVFQQDWDNLIVLDACRYDALAGRSGLPGRLESRESRSSATIEFLEANVAGRDLTDTVCVTATPQYHYFTDQLEITFHDRVDLWDDDENMWRSGDGRQAVLPETTTEHARKVAAAYPNKRILVHYTQPHIPFLDPATDVFQTDRNPYREMAAGRLDATGEEFRRTYQATLDRTLPHVWDLLDQLDGKTVLTADHGEMLGERAAPVPVRVWGHPHGVYTDELVTVPWLVSERGERREIVAESAVGDSSGIEQDTVEDRLAHLGYRT